MLNKKRGRPLGTPKTGGRKKGADPTFPVTVRLKKSTLEKLPADARERNAAIVAVIEQNF